MSQLLCPVVVGRAAEVQALESALEGTLTGRGGCVVLSGEAGIGKSRLIREVLRMAADRQVAAVSGRAVPRSTSTAYRPLTEALLQLLRRAPLPDDPSLAPWLPHLRPVLPGFVEVGGPAGGSPGSDAVTIRGEALLRVLRCMSPEGLVVTLEDIHWADPDTLEVLEYLADNATGLPLLFVVSLRPEPESPATELVRRQRGRPGVVQLPLERLSERDMLEMIAACRPGAAQEVRSRIVRVADGVPLLVEELLASPGIPESITDTVRVRLGEFGRDERAVLEAAAVLGRNFDWEILPAASGQMMEVVARALARAVEHQLVTADSGLFRFRHTLTREAVLAVMLPPRRREAAAAALAAIDSAHPYLEGPWREVAADLAAQAADLRRAGRLLADAGRHSLEVGALATAAQTLGRAIGLLEGDPERADVELLLLQALALAGRADEASGVATSLIDRLRDDQGATATFIEAHLFAAHASVAASRWAMARQHLSKARGLVDGRTDPALSARAAVLSADLAMDADDLDGARTAAEAVLAMDGASPEARCHAYEIVGRTLRLHDLQGAAASFESALDTAVAHDLPVWRMRALHELGTVDTFERMDTTRLLEARRLGEQMGALSTVAVLDLQLSAASTGRWDLEACDRHAAAALETALQLRLDRVASKAMALMAGSASMRADREATERWGGRAIAADPSDPMLPGFCRASVGMALLLAGDTDAAIQPFAEGTAALSGLPNAEPISIRALWPLIQAAHQDARRAARTIDEVRRLGVDAFALNRGLIGFARAVLEGRSGRSGRADAIQAELAPSLANSGTWADLARFIAAPRAMADGWGQPVRWLEEARNRFTGLGLHSLAGRCTDLLLSVSSNPWAVEGVTDREADVLRLIIDGRANKEIAATLRVSPRTVEKHVESLLRKYEAHSRTELAVAARRSRT